MFCAFQGTQVNALKSHTGMEIWTNSSGGVGETEEG